MRNPVLRRQCRAFIVVAIAIALIMSGLTLRPSAAEATGARRFGAYAGSASPDGVSRFGEWAGRSSDVAVTFLSAASWSEIEGPSWVTGTWGPWKRAVPGRLVSLSVPMLPGPSVDDATVASELRRGAAGEFDAHFRRLGANLVAAGLENSVLRIGWEMNGSWMRFRAKPDPAAWKAYFRRIVQAMRGVPGSSFVIDWSPVRGDFMWAYPGDDVVDIIGLDHYDQSWSGAYANNRLQAGWSFEQTWNEFLNQRGGLVEHAREAAARGKRMSFPEWGLFVRPDGRGGGDNPYFVRKMREWIDSHDVAYHAYFEYDAPDGKHRLMPADTLFPNAAREFRAQFSGSSSNTTTAPPSTTTTAPPSTTTTVAPAPSSTRETIWPGTATPGAISGDRRAVELGVKFRTDVTGSISGVRFYKAATNGGTHVASLWTRSGTLLARATFSSETASGWQEVTFPTPVRVGAGTTYIASYHTTQGRYGEDLGYFTKSYQRGHLTALKNGQDGRNGVYAYSSTPTFPSTASNKSRNYWVDVVFTAG